MSSQPCPNDIPTKYRCSIRSGPTKASKKKNHQIAEKFSFTWSTCSISAVLIHSFTWIIFKIVWLMVIAPWSRPTAHRAVLSIAHEDNAAKNPRKKNTTEDSDVGIYITSRSEMSYHSIQRCLTAPHTSQAQAEKKVSEAKKKKKHWKNGIWHTNLILENDRRNERKKKKGTTTTTTERSQKQNNF